MDPKLLGFALRYHGVDLLHSINKEQQEQPPVAALAFMDRKRQEEPEIRDAEFHRNLCSFIGRKADILFKPEPPIQEESASKDAENIDDAFAIMPAVETFMNVSFLNRREHFFKSLRTDDCVSGEVVGFKDKGLRIKLLCVDRGCIRDIDDLDIQASCPVNELPKLYPNESALEAFQVKDIIRGIVLMVNPESGRIIISMHDKAIPDKNTFPRIGLITEEDFPVYYRRKKQIKGMDYDEMLHSILGFNNMGNVQVLRSLLGVREGGSYMRYLSRLQIPEKEFMEGLRKWQSQKLAHQSVAQGVDMFKGGKHLEAMQFFNRALQIDKQNVEALVARGALYANKESFNQAIQDFEDALAINPQHSNAKNYLIETLLTFGKMCEDKGQIEESIVHYTHALKVEPEHSEAKELLTGSQRLLIAQSMQGKGKTLAKNVKSQPEFLGNEFGNLAIMKAAEKLRLLINEDKKGESSEHKTRARSRNRSTSPLDKSGQKRKRSRSSSSRRSGSSSPARWGRKARVSRSPQSGARSHKFSPVRDEIRGKIEDRKEIYREHVKGETSASFWTKKPERDQSQATSSASGLLPVSSPEYFSNKASIPGLSSPLPARGDAKGLKRAVEHSLPEKKTERGEQHLSTEKRRDEYLMAEREKFYKDHKDRFKRFRPNSASPESSHSPETSKRLKSQDISRAESTIRTLEKKSDKELNMYIEGASKLLELIKSSSEKDPAWSYVSQIFLQKVGDPNSKDEKARPDIIKEESQVHFRKRINQYGEVTHTPEEVVSSTSANTERKRHGKAKTKKVDMLSPPGTNTKRKFKEKRSRSPSNEPKGRIKVKRSPSPSNVAKGRVKEKKSLALPVRSSKKNKALAAVRRKKHLTNQSDIRRKSDGTNVEKEKQVHDVSVTGGDSSHKKSRKIIKNNVQSKKGTDGKVVMSGSKDRRTRSRSRSRGKRLSSRSASRDRGRSRSLSKGRRHSRSLSECRRRSRSLSKGKRHSRSLSKGKRHSRSLSKGKRHSRSPSRGRRRSQSSNRDKSQNSRSKSRDKRRYSRSRSRDSGGHNRSREPKRRSKSTDGDGRHSRNEGSHKERSTKQAYRTVTEARYWHQKADVIVEKDPKLFDSDQLEKEIERRVQERLNIEKEKQQNEKKSRFDSFFEGGTKNEIDQSLERGPSSGPPVSYKAGVKTAPQKLKSKWDVDEVASDRIEANKEELVDMDTIGRGGRKESLTDLEKFLLDLKEQKKKQWIAEGKVKKKT